MMLYLTCLFLCLFLCLSQFLPLSFNLITNQNIFNHSKSRPFFPPTPVFHPPLHHLNCSPPDPSPPHLSSSILSLHLLCPLPSSSLPSFALLSAVSPSLLPFTLTCSLLSPHVPSPPLLCCASRWREIASYRTERLTSCETDSTLIGTQPET